MNTLCWTHSFSASLAHRYWVEDLGPVENEALFGRSASSVGVGHNFEVAVTFDASLSREKDRLNQMERLKAGWDHQNFLTSSPTSTLEVLTWQWGKKLPSSVVTLEVSESSHLRALWSREQPEELALIVGRPLSVLWKPRGGGARLNMELVFRGPFQEEKLVLFPRPFLEELSLPELELSLNVKENKEIMDALFKEIHRRNSFLVSLRLELENKRKWLIHSPFLTR